MKLLTLIVIIAQVALATEANYFDRAKANFEIGTPLVFMENLTLKLQPTVPMTCVQKSDPSDLERIRIDILKVDPDMAVGPKIVIKGEGYWDLLSDGTGELKGSNGCVEFTLRKGRSVSGAEFWVSKWEGIENCHFETYCWMPVE